MKIVIEKSQGIIQRVITTGKAKVSILDYDAMELASNIRDVESSYFSFSIDKKKNKKELNEYIEEVKFTAVDDFLNSKIPNQKHLKYIGYIDECAKCGDPYESRYLYAKCPVCSTIEVNCNLCSMNNCGTCKNGSNFDGE